MTQNKISFYLLVVSQGIGLIGSAILRFAISLHILDLTGSAEIFATIVAVSFLPLVLFMPLGGAIADRYSKKMMLVICDSASALTITILAVLLFGGSQSILVLGAAITLLTLISALYFPAVSASMPAILEKDELVRANGIMQGIRSISMLASPMLAALLFGAVGVENLVGLCAIIFLFSAIINIFIKIPFTPKKAEKGAVATIAGDIKEGFVYITKENTLLFKAALVFSAVLFFHQAMLSVTIPYMIRITLGLEEIFFGIGNASIGIATLAASIMSGRLRKYLQMRHMFIYIGIIGIATISVSLSALFAQANVFAAYGLLVAGFMTIMFCFSLTNILITSHAQANVPAHMVGKAMAIVITIANGAAPAGQVLLGLLIENMANEQFILYAAIAIITLGLALAARRRLAAA